VYEARNVASQDVVRGDVGQPKVRVQRRRLRRINPAAVVAMHVARVEDVPRARLRADVIVACLDSRVARQTVNEIAWQLGVPWIDAGVERTGLLARVHVYVPGLEAPCLECAWDERAYAALEQRYPCQGVARTQTRATAAPSSLGGLAAALQAIECAKLLAGDTAHALIGREVVIDARSHRHYVSSFRRNVHCRLSPHVPLEIEPMEVSGASTFDALLAAARSAGATGTLEVGVEGQRLAAHLTCENPECEAQRNVWRVERAMPRARCRRCGHAMHPRGFDMRDRGLEDELPDPVRRRPLRASGVVNGDIVTVADGMRGWHFEVTGDGSGRVNVERV
jgi:molybdopterin/thiamine biosynthesis adenylyltransferase